MTTLNLMIPDSLKEHVDSQIAAGGHGSASDYVLSVLLEDQKRKAWEKVEALVLEGLSSGPGIEATPAYWEQKRKQLLERFPEANQPGVASSWFSLGPTKTWMSKQSTSPNSVRSRRKRQGSPLDTQRPLGDDVPSPGHRLLSTSFLDHSGRPMPMLPFGEQIEELT